MNARLVCSALILAGLFLAMEPPLSYAQSTAPGASAPKPAAAPNTNTNPTKHRHWRHRGGKHPHFGSRRLRT